jgi:hypothetical protein
VSIAAVAFVPAAPLLVPQVAGGSARLDDPLRTACVDAVTRALSSAKPVEVVIVAPGSAGEWTQGATWDFAGFGVARRPPDPRPVLPWQLGIGAWLVDEAGWTGRRRYVGVGEPVGAQAPARTVRRDSGRTVVVAVGDGSGCRTERAPGHLDHRAEAFDDAVAAALAQGDAAGFDRIDDALARDLLCAGLPVWRWVSSALAGQPVATAEISAQVAPYGVGYFVALWVLATAS